VKQADTVHATKAAAWANGRTTAKTSASLMLTSARVIAGMSGPDM